MKEIILAYQGEMTLKGLNRGTFEAKLSKAIRHRLEDLGEFKIRQAQSTVFIQPKSDDIDMDEVFRRVSKVFGIVKLSRAVLPFLGAMLVGVLLVAYIPALSLCLL